ncbi:hypothetical protein B9Z55_013521 [Caenorhabditis nigoni]|uniref:G-protein coupled receptors family 1 profile domain-containing protein n=2 Tax=Caenorhabditis nigoni TaxID=1611254 RepID=A0A2G5U226_9PELO|nr:hypothetical protein B9Z55_013521 [Caenorhabditis nigoni]
MDTRLSLSRIVAIIFLQMNNSLEPPQWGFYVYYGMSIVSLPLYLLIIVCLLCLRGAYAVYKSTFYSLLLQHCIADMFSMLGYILLSPARAIPQIRQFYFEYQDYYIAAATYNIIYYTLYIRCTGIIFLSLQRYLVITLPHWSLTTKVQKAANWKIILVYWITPTLLSIVVLKDTDFKFDGIEKMAINASKEIIQRNTVMALSVVSTTCIVSSLAYGALFYFVRKNSSKLSKSLRREVHLAFQVLVLLLAFFAILVFYAFLNYFAQTRNDGPVFYMRGLYPMANGFLSYINPFCILCLNQDFTRKLIGLVTCNVNEVRGSGKATNSNKKVNVTLVQIEETRRSVAN